jgi:hypothetical protein
MRSLPCPCHVPPTLVFLTCAVLLCCLWHSIRCHLLITHSSLPCVFLYRLQLWADNCFFEHSPWAMGENLGIGPPLKIVNLWYEEVCLYNYSNPRFNETTGHFTQVGQQQTAGQGGGGGVLLDTCSCMAFGQYHQPAARWPVLLGASDDRQQRATCQFSRWLESCRYSLHGSCMYALTRLLNWAAAMQLVWAGTTAVGCAIGNCPYGTMDVTGGSSHSCAHD